MNLKNALLALSLAAAASVFAIAACSDNNTDACPADPVVGGATCSSPNLQCGVLVPIVGCDGTQSAVVSSCTCVVTTTSQQWSCVDPGNQCPDAAPASDPTADASPE